MPLEQDHRFNTQRLLVDEWHSFSSDEWAQQSQAATVQEILTPVVTKSLPPAWHGPYTLERAQQWVNDRDSEGTTLLAIDSTDQQVVGLVITFDTDSSGHLRLGYMLNKSVWGKGFATEIVSGFVNWCRANAIKSIVAGVEEKNIASARVLEKCGFIPVSSEEGNVDLMFKIELAG